MKKSLILSSLLLAVLFFSNCNKEIDEPKHKADGRNLVFIRVDDKDEFLLDSRSKFFHKNTASNLEVEDNILYSEFKQNNRVMSDFSFTARPLKYKKAQFALANLRLRFDKETQVLDTAFLNNWLSKTNHTTIYFNVSTDECKEYYIDSILDYKIVKWDQK